MKVNRHSSVRFGILKQHIVRQCAPGGRIDLFNGETSKSLVQVYKEYTMGKLDLQLFIIKDKFTGSVSSKLQHIDHKNRRKTVFRHRTP